MTCPPCTHDCNEGRNCPAGKGNNMTKEALKFAKAITQPNTITFHNSNADWVMRITADRRIEVNEDVEVTEAAQKVLDAMQQLLTNGLDKAVAAEREACAKIVEEVVPFGLELRLQKATIEDCAAAIRARGQA